MNFSHIDLIVLCCITHFRRKAPLPPLEGFRPCCPLSFDETPGGSISLPVQGWLGFYSTFLNICLHQCLEFSSYRDHVNL